MLICQATEADIPTLVAMRMALFCEVGELPHPAADPALMQTIERYFTNAFLSGSALSWLAEVDKQVVAAGTLAMFVRPPYPGNLAGREAYLLNMYTLPDYRKLGAASALLDVMAAPTGLARYGSMPARLAGLSMSGSVLSPIRPIWSGNHLPGEQ